MVKTYEEFSLSKNTLIIPSFPDSMNFWHGGNLDDFNDNISQKNGRYEYGPGLYLTTHYGTATNYAKGSRKLYLISVSIGNEINESFIDFDVCKVFVKDHVIKSLQKEVLSRLGKYKKENNKVKGYIFSNIILNENAIKSTNTKYLRQFYIDNNIDYEIVDNPFGWGEKMMVLYNMKKIINIITIKPTDKITNYDLLNSVGS